MPTWDSCIKYVKYYKNVDLYSLYLQTPHKRKLIEDKLNSIKASAHSFKRLLHGC